MSETSHGLPLPELSGLHGEFYQHCKAHELRFQKCSGCGAWRHVPRELCAECGSWDWEWAASTGRGSIYTWTVVNRPLHPQFAEACPYAPVVVELEEGVRLLSQVVDVEPDALEIGMPVEVVFDDVTDEVTLPKFKRAD